MKRKNVINLIILLILIIASFLIIRENKSSTLKLEKDAFSVKDTAQISKIFIADMQGNKITLSRKENQWLINNTYPANNVRIDNMLEVLFKIEVKNPVPKSMMESVIKNMSTESVKVEIYTKKKKPLKVIYVGGPTQDYTATFMALDKKGKIPFIVHIPGWYGYLSEGYFYTNIDEWRSKELFHYNPTNIKQITIKYKDMPDSSFTLKVSPDYSFELVNSGTNSIIKDISDIKAKAFINAFSELYFVNIAYNMNKNKKDSLMHSKPLIIIKVTTTGNHSRSLSLYYKTSDIRTKVELKEGIDGEYFYGILSNRKEEVLIVQRLNIDRILWKIEDFLN